MTSPLQVFHYRCFRVNFVKFLKAAILQYAWSSLPLYLLNLSDAKYKKTIQPISCHCFLSIPPENIQKPRGFLIFPGVIERDQWHEMVNCSNLRCLLISTLSSFAINILRMPSSIQYDLTLYAYPQPYFLSQGAYLISKL